MEEKNSNILKQCNNMGLKTWQCPPIIFAVMIVVTLGVTFFVASKFILGLLEAVLIISILALFYVLFGYFILTSFRKMADAHRMEEEMRQITSHQLKKPLDNFKSAVDRLGKEIDVTEERMRNLVADLKESTDKMSRAVNFFLEVKELEEEGVELRCKSFDLGNLARQELENFTDTIRDAGFELTLEVPSQLSRVRADEEKIGMVIQNFIDNAIKYSPAGGVIEVKLEEVGSELRLSVSDEGIGIPESEKKYIFEKYFRAKNAEKIVGSGTGMGLYISKLIVKACGGEVGFESKKNEGSTFWFTLPTSS